MNSNKDKNTDKSVPLGAMADKCHTNLLPNQITKKNLKKIRKKLLNCSIGLHIQAYIHI